MTNGRETAVADLVIRGGTVVSPDAQFAASVAIKDGKVLAVGAHEAIPAARETLDASGLHVLPGAIDVHVHFRDPGYAHKEDFESGTAAAAFGGVTTVFDMPNTIPPTGTAETLAAKHALAAEKAHVDFGLYGLLGEDTIAHVPELVAGGVIGFKLYMGNTFGKIPSPSTGAMLEAFETVAPTGKRISLHAETNSIMELRETRLREAGRTDPLAHLASRPAVVAVEAVSRAAILSEWTGARIHILHISSADELAPLREAKARGVEITGETGRLQANPSLARSIEHRFPYLDPLNHIQIELLKQHRASGASEHVLRGIQLTINGISAGLRNSG